MDFIIPTIISSQLPIPLYITWGKISSYPEIFVPSGLRNLEFVPGWHEVNYLHTQPGTVVFSRWIKTINLETRKQSIYSCRDSDPYVPPQTDKGPLLNSDPDVSASPPATSHPFPPVERYSGQCEGENMTDFFLQRQRNNAKKAEHETRDERQRREQKEANAAKGDAPGRKGARVFVWEETDGHYIRRAAGRQNYDDYWAEYGPNQRHYDSHYDEWDLCEQFGDPPDPPDDDEDQFPEHPLLPEDDDFVLPEMLPETEEKLEEGEIHSSEADLKRIHNITESSHATETGLNNEMDHFRLFLAHCKEAKSVFDIPTALLDFHQQDSELHSSDWTVCVRRAILNEQMHYIISEKQPDWRNMCIVVQSATTALEIVRQAWGPNLRDVMEKLLSWGISFLTCLRSEQTSRNNLSIRDIRYSGLGYRPPKYKPDLTDYHTYVALRRRFLRSPRGGAALLFGGIVGRLARSDVSVEEVLRGPSDDALLNGICLWDGHSVSAYWDDCLSQQEIDLICGVYHIATG
ncbi:hypothetical protein FB451DRAFT_1061024 [Mycena latifolia]|nr:hypothetical protein FB451DRAFT_1061024 [Mycena latifolia]